MIRQLKTVTAALLALLLVAPPVSAQETTGAPASTSVASLRDALAADSSIGDEERTALSERLNGAARDLELAASAEAELRSLKETLAESAELIADYENRATDIRRAPATVQRRLGPNPDLAALEAEIGVIDGQRSDWVRQRKEALDATAAMAQKDGELRKLLAELGAPGGDARSAAVDAGAPIADQIAHFAARAAAKARTQRRELIELQLRGSPELNRIRSARVSWLDAAIAEADALLTALREAAAASRESAGEQRSAETRRIIDSLSDPSPALRQIADGNLEIINEFRELGRDIEARRQGLARKRQTIEDIQQDAQLTQRRLEVSGLGAALGDVMLSRLASLPNPATILADSRSRNARIADVSSAAIDSEQLLRRFSDRSAYDALLAGGALTPGEERAAERLLDQRRSLLQGNLQAQNTLLRLLVDENQTAQELATVTEDYQAMLTGNLLWVRNYNYARPEQLLAQVEVLLTMISRWQPLDRVSALTRDVPFVVGAVLLMAVALRRRATRRALQEM
ncbi:MAG: hypothetical protein V2I82_09770, partial [Halieaceae bacterium]|nr:hypothetical protein [Halieaceae bacterium]